MNLTRCWANPDQAITSRRSMQSSEGDTHLALSSSALSLALFMSMQALFARCGRWGKSLLWRACQITKCMQSTHVGEGVACIRQDNEMR